MDKIILKTATDKYFNDLVTYAKSKTTGNLQQSLKYTNDGQGHIAVEMEDYGEFQDQGVNGKNKAQNSPFGYKSKRPPISALSQWAKAKGLNPWAVSNSIFEDGIKAKNFLMKPFNESFDELAEIINKALAEDIEIDITNTLDTI